MVVVIPIRKGGYCQNRHRSKPRAVHLLNELFARAADCYEYKLFHEKGDYQDLFGRVPRFQKKIDVQMRPYVCSGSGTIAVLSFLFELKDACSLNCVPKFIAVRCFQSYVKGQEKSLLWTGLTGSSMAVNHRRSEMLHTSEDVVSLLLQTYETAEVSREVYNDVLRFRQSSAMTEENYSRMPWNKGLRCKSIFFGRRLNSVFIDGLLPRMLAQTRQLFSLNPYSAYYTVV